MSTFALKTKLLLLFLTALLIGCGGGSGTDEVTASTTNVAQGQNQGTGTAPILSFRVVNTFPHDTNAFTQGLVFDNGRFFESTGLVGQSDLREVDITTGNVNRIVNNAANLFGEGLALRAGVLYQLTLNSGNTILWNQGTFTQNQTLATPVPSWGLAYDPVNDRFVFSNGSSTLRFLNPTTFAELGSVTVTDNGVEVNLLNELEYVNGLIYANRFLTDEIVVINPATGVLVSRINLNGIIDKVANGLGGNDVLNGIAFDPATNRLFVTGKRWPSVFEIQVVP